MGGRADLSAFLSLSDHYSFAFFLRRCLLSAKPSRHPPLLLLPTFFSLTPLHGRMHLVHGFPLYPEHTIVLGNFSVHTEEPANALASDFLYFTTPKTFMPFYRTTLDLVVTSPGEQHQKVPCAPNLSLTDFFTPIPPLQVLFNPLQATIPSSRFPHIPPVS